MKVVSYALYRDNPVLFNYYLRGVYFNARLIKHLLPDYKMHVAVCESLWSQQVVNDLVSSYGVVVTLMDEEHPSCIKMLNRFVSSIDDKPVDILFMRDSDSCLTFREVQAIREFEQSDKTVHGINDNPAHSIPLMGGLIGMKQSAIDKFSELLTTSDALHFSNQYKFRTHGSDQDFLMREFYPLIKDDILLHKFSNREPQPNSNPLWITDLFQRYIGCAGCIEMEVVRWLNERSTQEDVNFETKYQDLFYWRKPL